MDKCVGYIHDMNSEKKNATRTMYIYSLGLYFFLLPLNAINIGTIGSVLKIIALLPILFGILSVRTIRIGNLIKSYFFYLFISALSLVWTISFSETFSRCVSYFQFFALMLIAGCINYRAREIAFLKRSLAAASLASAVVILIFGEFIQGRLWLTGVLKEDPNYFCMYLVFGIIYNLQRLMIKDKLYKKIVSILLLFGYMAIIVLTGSRGGLIAILVAIIAYVVFNNGKFISAKKIVIFSLVALSIVLAINMLSSRLIRERFTLDSVLSTGGTGRFEIWEQGIKLFTGGSLFNQLFGYGAATVKSAFINNGFPIASVMHNLFLENLVEIGIVGFIIYLVMIIAFFKKSYNNSDRFSFAVIFGMIALSISTSIYTFKPYINIMIMIICEGRLIIQHQQKEQIDYNGGLAQNEAD